jgi:hypothetical protein
VADSNYDQFNEMAGNILAHLLQCVPLPSSETVGKITGIMHQGNINASDEPPYNWVLFHKTTLWLRDEGFIRFGISENEFNQFQNKHKLPKATLTLKGLEALKSVPDPLNPNSGDNLADSLIKSANEGAKEEVKSLVKTGFTSMFTYLTSM